MDRRNSFDLTRLIAAALVLFSHCFALAKHDASEPLIGIAAFGTFGELAVDMFFVISGYLVAGSYIRGSGPIEFFLKRALRLLPALLVAVLLTVFVLGPMVTTLPWQEYFRHGETYNYLRNLYLDVQFYLPSVFSANPYPNAVNGSLWTLPLEVLMYLLVMALGMLKLLSARGCAVAAMAFACLDFVVPSTAFTDNGVVLQLMPYADLTRLGTLYFLGSFFVFAPAHWLKKKVLFWALLIAPMFLGHSSTGQVVSLMSLAYVTLTVAHWKSTVSDTITKVGDYSYGVYVYAFPVQQTCVMLLGNHAIPMAVLFFSLPITLVFAAASWHFVEKPALTLKRFLVFPKTALLVSVRGTH